MIQGRQDRNRGLRRTACGVPFLQVASECLAFLLDLVLHPEAEAAKNEQGWTPPLECVPHEEALYAEGQQRPLTTAGDAEDQSSEGERRGEPVSKTRSMSHSSSNSVSRR